MSFFCDDLAAAASHVQHTCSQDLVAFTLTDDEHQMLGGLCSVQICVSVDPLLHISSSM